MLIPKRPAPPLWSGLALAMLAILFIGCGEDSPTAPSGATGDISSNMSFDRLGVAVVPGGSAQVAVSPLAGTLDPITVASSDEGVATATGAETVITVTGVGYGSAIITVATAAGGERTFPVTVYDPMVLDAGELLLRYTGEFATRYHDSGSGAANNGDFYMPVPPEGYHALGAVGFAGYRNPAAVGSAALVVRDKGDNPSNPPLKAPVGYEHIWNNGVGLFGSWIPDGDVTGSFWRPIPPEGYVALGVVVHNWTPNAANPVDQAPPLDAVMCVRADLTRTAGIGAFVWNDSESGLPIDFRADQIVIPPSYDDYEKMLVAPGAVAAHASHAVNDNNNPVANVLVVRPPVLLDADYHSTLWRPELTSLADPGASSQPLRTRSILVPFTAFEDGGRDIAWKVANSPFYVLEREFYWDRECFASAFNDCELSYTAGTGRTQTNTTWEQTSVTASQELGFELKGVGGKVKSTVSKSLGFAESIGVSQFFETTVSTSVPAPGEGHIMASWKGANRFSLRRHNGTAVESVVTPWTVYETQFHSSRFP
jgi:hypothetical protein